MLKIFYWKNVEAIQVIYIRPRINLMMFESLTLLDRVMSHDCRAGLYLYFRIVIGKQMAFDEIVAAYPAWNIRA